MSALHIYCLSLYLFVCHAPNKIICAQHPFCMYFYMDTDLTFPSHLPYQRLPNLLIQCFRIRQKLATFTLAPGKTNILNLSRGKYLRSWLFRSMMEAGCGLGERLGKGDMGGSSRRSSHHFCGGSCPLACQGSRADCGMLCG